MPKSWQIYVTLENNKQLQAKAETLKDAETKILLELRKEANINRYNADLADDARQEIR